MVPPIAQAIGINEKPRAMFVLSVSSAIILFMTPMFPFSISFKQRLGNSSWSKLFPGFEPNTPEGQRPERSRKSKEDAGGSSTQKAAQEYGLTTYPVRKTAPLEHSDGLSSKIQGQL